MGELVDAEGRLLTPDTATPDRLAEAVAAWVERYVPAHWIKAAPHGRAALRAVRPRAEYEAWYPVFGRSGLVVPTWERVYGGLGLTRDQARAAEAVLAPYNLGRLNPLGLGNAAPALFAHGTEEQRLRFLPPMVRNEEFWCQLFSEPGAGSDLASLATRAERDEASGDWLITGQKVWTTWGFKAAFGVLLARTDPDVPKRQGLTYFLLDLRQPGVTVRPLRTMTGEAEFSEVFLDRARVPDAQRVGAVGDGWKVAGATLSGERQMVSGAGSGGVDRIGGSGVAHLLALARRISAEGRPGGWDDPAVRQELMRLYSEERIRSWTNERVRAGAKAGHAPGPASSIGKLHQGELNQRMQALAAELLGAYGQAWEPDGTGDPTAAPDPTATVDPTAAPDPTATADPTATVDPDPALHDLDAGYEARLPHEVRGMLRSRANTIEGGTSEVNRTVLAERVLGLPREPDPWHGVPWRDVPRS
ncbi:acyl-CoA dehydrogenase family protein [Yinghuangia seranimata]|uniref:acyl-CoA dehydrogenase family protein n=1 Tax=Yinghuangia seranimata TaxID=408067 RepID=UPI00248AA76B|nr:acyl-CoA dehydrogenase family protein [Yinghuangia seranimata]MDI2125349.1 acyl-CoA dehydrogenase family protein [Yinghuangia seranimata]